MKGLLKYVSPFAPDQSGAVSVFYELGGITVICDAGGCTGNICGFDEPRWFLKKSALFSAGLRDMDAILGRDDRLVEKTEGRGRPPGRKIRGADRDSGSGGDRHRFPGAEADGEKALRPAGDDGGMHRDEDV